MNTLCENSYYIASVGLIAVGLYVMVAKKNLIKVFIGLTLFETGINLLLITVGYLAEGTAPIFSKAGLLPERMVDPVPQALVLTSIVIGVAVLALALSLAIRLYEYYGTLNLRKVRGLKW
jgi:multicomponent Na+:H+ antiporter subunit C